MKVKMSVTLSKDLLEATDKGAERQNITRSDFIEVALRNFIQNMVRKEQTARDIETINRCADSLNREAYEVLEYQVPL